MAEKKKIYASCDHLQKTFPDATIDQDLIHRIATEYRTLPSFENTSYEHKLVNHYSLETNELLKCRWDCYKKNVENKVFAPFQFPDVRHLHFFNGTIRFAPTLTLYNQPSFKKKFKIGPGLDSIGQMLIPNESFMKRGIDKKDEKLRKKQKEKKSEEQKKDKDGKETKKAVKETKKSLAKGVEKVEKQDEKKHGKEEDEISVTKDSKKKVK